MDLTRRMRPLLGTFVEVAADRAAAVERAFDSLEAAQARWSFHRPDSALSRLNAGGDAPVPLDAATLRLLRCAVAMMRASGGLFDCSVGGTLVAQGVLPDHGGAAPLPRGSADDLEIGRGWAGLRRPVRWTLDGIAKGFAVDLAVGAMRRAGATAGWVNAGGDLRVFGEIELPVQRRELDGRLTPLGGLRNAALASSRSGPPDPAFPARIVAPEGTTLSPGVWTVCARTAWRADALTKVAATASGTDADRALLVARLGGQLQAKRTAFVKVRHGSGSAGP